MPESDSPRSEQSKPSVGGRSSYHHGQLREEMLRIGLELAAEGGPHAVGIREITRRAGVTSAAAYRHFRDQQELRDKIAREVDKSLAEALIHAVADQGVGSATDRLRAIGRSYFDFAVTQEHLFEYLNHGFNLSSQDSVLDVLVNVVAEVGREQLGHEPDRAEATDRAIALWAAGHGICVLCSSGALKDLPLDRKKHLQEVTMTNAIAGLRF